MAPLSDHDTRTDDWTVVEVAPPSDRAASLRAWSGAIVTATGLTGWIGWLTWRIATPTMTFTGLAVLVAELVAFAAALTVSAGLVVTRPVPRRNRRASDRGRPLLIRLAEAFDIGAVVSESACQPLGDDTGEIAWARRGIRVLGEQRPTMIAAGGLRDAAWSVVAIDGLRRAFAVGVLVVVLFSGSVPFERPPVATTSMLAGGLMLVSLGHWLMSAGHLRPGARFIWSMSSIGAGLGDGVSRSGRPIRWMATMATLVVLNISIALRGISDRWTHGLGPMDRDGRIAAMSVALVFVIAGGVALARMPRPEEGFYGATRRLEEDSVRRLALGLTLLVAIVGFVAGILPADAATAAR